MNILTFAKLNGVTFKNVGGGWGGHIGYSTENAPQCTNCGYKTKTEASEAWLTELGLSKNGIEVLKKALEKV